MTGRLLAACRTGAALAVPPILLLLLWQGSLTAGLVDPEFLPAPLAVARALADLLSSRSFYVDIATTFARSLGGLALGIILGVPIGTVMALSSAGERFFGPLIKATYSLPKTALVPLLILWFGISSTTNVLAVLFSTILPIVIYVYHGLQGVPRLLIWSAHSMGTSRREIVRLVRFPSALHDILTGCRIALGFSFVIAIAAEMIAAKVGAGKLVMMYGENGSYDYMFAAIAALVALACLADGALVALAAYLLRWRDPAARQI
jgi:ABC-type nitrate/sulfonate/bicarbonate transport system permease component